MLFYSTLEKTDIYKDKIIEYKNELQIIDDELNKSIIKSNIDGQVQLNGKLVEGDFLQTGQKILSIVEDIESYKAYFLIPATDMENINIGDNIKIEVGPLSKVDYGSIKSEIKTIATVATLTDDESQQEPMYLMTADLNSSYMSDKKGKTTKFKKGMPLNGIIINKEISYLRYIIEYFFNII